MTKKELEKHYHKSLIDEHVKSGKLAVTLLSYDCLRHAYYTETLGSFFSRKTLEIFSIGKSVHTKQIIQGAEKELTLETEDIKGVVDEYLDGTILDIKTVGKIPSSNFIAPHYVKQLEYYAWLLRKDNRQATDAWLLYIQKDPPNHKFVKVNLRDHKEIEEEILKKAQTLRKALEEERPPKRKFGWLCSYCNFASHCYKNGKSKVEKKDLNKKD